MFIRIAFSVAIFALAVATPANAGYVFRCMSSETQNYTIQQYELIKFRTPMSNCDERREYCRYALVLFPDRYDLDGPALLLTANMSVCPNNRDLIVQAYQNQDAELIFHKMETECKKVHVGQLARWLNRGYAFKALVQCVDNMCLWPGAMRPWRYTQRGYCHRYLQE